MKLSTEQVALMAVFASLYYVLSIFTPYVPALGVPGLKISLEALTASIFGLILGPYLGMLAALIGVGVAWTFPPGSMSPYGLPFLLSPPLNALVVGLLYYRKWKAAFVTLSLLIVAFLFLPPSQPFTENLHVVIAVLWDKVIALFLIIPCVKFARRLSLPQTLPILLFLLAFIGNQADNMWGTDAFAVPIVYEGIFGLPLDAVRDAFLISPFLYPAIRLIQATIATVIAIPLIRALKDTSWTYPEKTLISN